MSEDNCILTTKDLTILEVMLDRCADHRDPLADLLRRKIGGAAVTFRDHVPDDCATLSSRVAYSIDGLEQAPRVISHDRMNAAVGLFLPITTVRGLALLGLRAGQAIALREEVLRLDGVLYQPEAGRRERRISEPREAVRGGTPMLRLIRGGLDGVEPGLSGFDDPGPSAA